MFQSDGQWIASSVDLDTLDRDTLLKTKVDGRFELKSAPRAIAGLFFVATGFCVAEWFDLSADPDANQDHRVVLAPATPVRGRVVDTSDRPIPRARVTLMPRVANGASMTAAAAVGAPQCFREKPWSRISRLTDADGSFAFESVSDMPCNLWAFAPGYDSSFTPHEVATPTTTFEIVLRRADAALLDVRDAQTKRPLAHPRAFVLDELKRQAEELILPFDEFLAHEASDGERRMSEPGRLLVWRATSSPQGASFDGRFTRHFVVFAEGYAPRPYDLLESRERELAHETIELEPRAPVATLSGRVEGATEARLDLRFDPPHLMGGDPLTRPIVATAASGPDGRFAFHDLPPAPYYVCASAPGCTPVCFDVRSPDDGLAIRFTPAARLEARVVDATGTPVAGQLVQVQALDGKRAWRAISDADGIAHLDGLPGGSCDVLAFLPNRWRLDDSIARVFMKSTYLPDERVELKAGATISIDVPMLERVPVRLHLRFDDGAPAAGAKVSGLWAESGPQHADPRDSDRLQALALRSADDGRIDVELLPATYHLELAIGGVNCSRTFTVARRVPEEIVVDVTNVRSVGRVYGRVVTTPGGRPLAGWLVTAFVPGRDIGEGVKAGTCKSADDGSFDLPRCPAGPLVVMARVPDGESRDVDAPFASLTLDLPVSSSVDVTIPIPNAAGGVGKTVSFDVAVTSKDDGAPIPFVQVLLEGTIGAVQYGLLSTSIPCDLEGGLKRSFLACERYRVRLFPPSDRSDAPSRWKPFDVEVIPVDGSVRVRAALERAESR
jgi:hypothetical protein